MIRSFAGGIFIGGNQQGLGGLDMEVLHPKLRCSVLLQNVLHLGIYI